MFIMRVTPASQLSCPTPQTLILRVHSVVLYFPSQHQHHCWTLSPTPVEFHCSVQSLPVQEQVSNLLVNWNAFTPWILFSQDQVHCQTPPTSSFFLWSSPLHNSGSLHWPRSSPHQSEEQVSDQPPSQSPLLPRH